jgi:tRNA(Ser,Leu) C12 N-acetylase TAN1
MEVFSINSTEKFDMIVMFNEGDNDELDDELLGIKEIKHILDNININFYIKESECADVVLVEFGTNYFEAAIKLMTTPTKRISRAIPINIVVKTNFELILNKVKDLSLEKTNSGDTFFVICDVMNETKLRASDIKNAVKEELINSGLKFDDNNPEWNIYIEIIGGNTGISILRSGYLN